MPDDQPRARQSQSDPFYYLCQHFSKRKEGYHRSKIYSPSIHCKQHGLVTAAGPIFALIDRLRQASTKSTHQPMALEHWQHEMQAFIDHATTSAYSEKTIAAASFALTALIDETIKTRQSSTQENTTLLPKTISGAHQTNLFFELIEACQQDKQAHLDLIELLYLCIENGYTGHYTQHHQGLHQLAQISHQLFTTIQQHRPLLLTPSPPQNNSTTPSNSPHSWRKPMQWALLLGLPLLLAAGSHGWQHHPMQPLAQYQTANHLSTHNHNTMAGERP